MASRISQMRNGQLMPQQQLPMQQQQLNNAVNNMRNFMQQMRTASNPQAMLAEMLKNNPNAAAIAAMTKNGGSLEQIARQMAQANGIDINQLISQLSR